VYSSAYAINNLGQIVGDASVASGFSHAFRWQDGTMTDLGLFPGVASGSSRALAINDAGVIVGHASTPSGDHAFRWVNGTMFDMATLGGTESWARSVNSAGQIVGHSTTATSLRGFYYGGGGLIPLNPLAGDDQSIALGINDSGQIVGRSESSVSGAWHAVLWKNRLTPPADLNTLIAPDSGWRLDSASSINGTGQIVGAGFHDGNYRGFLLTPIPEPKVTALILFIICARLQSRCCRPRGAV
jgi:probable HAF family extracellular repeat protein